MSYDNWAKVPMKIFLYIGLTLVGSSLYSVPTAINTSGDTEYLLPYFIGGIVCLVISFILKIININLGDQ